MHPGQIKVSKVTLHSLSVYLFYTRMFDMPNKMTFQVKVMSKTSTTQIALKTRFHSTFIAFMSSKSTLAWVQFVAIRTSVQILLMFGSSADRHFTPHKCIPWSSTHIPLQHLNKTCNKKHSIVVMQRHIQLTSTKTC